MAGRGEPQQPSVEIELRLVTADDWELWRVLRLEALAEAPYAFSSKLADWASAPEARWRARLGHPADHNLAALVDGRPVGMASGIPGDEAGSVQVVSMWVSPSGRGLGTADALLDAIEDWARDGGAHTLCLDVRATNDRALRLYERHGLVVTGEVARESTDDPLELRMCKSIRGRR